MRRDAIYPSIVVGKPPQEDAWLGKATERIFLPAVRMTRARDRRLRPAGRGRVPQLRDRLDPEGLPGPRPQGHARDLGARDAQPHEGGRRRRRRTSTCTTTRRSSSTSARTSTRSGTSCSPKGRSTTSTTRRRCQFFGGKLGIDATAKGPAEGAREWPEEIEMSDEVRDAASTAAGPSTGSPAHARTATGTEWLSPRVAPADTSLTARSAGIESTDDRLVSRYRRPGSRTLPAAEPLADRLRRRDRVHPRRADRQLDRGCRRRGDRGRLRLPLGLATYAGRRGPRRDEPEPEAAARTALPSTAVASRERRGRAQALPAQHLPRGGHARPRRA